jgi:hypothetical protein
MEQVMFKWLTSRTERQSSGTQPLDSTRDAASPSDVKDHLFYEWATETYGEDEGATLFRACLEAQRFTRMLYSHGSFPDARDALLRIAMAFPNAATMPASTNDQPPDSLRYRSYLMRWCMTYPPPPDDVRK